MRLHTDVLERGDLSAAIQDRGVYIEYYSKHGSRSRGYAFEVRLAAQPDEGHRRRRNTGRMGAEDGGRPMYVAAATWDEHGRWLAALYERDPDMIVAGWYASREHFHTSTDGTFLIEELIGR